MKNKKIIILISIVLIIGGIIYFINDNKKSKGSLEKSSLRLKWVCQAQFAGFYVASSEGFYKDAGLDVEIVPAGPNISPIQSVLSGSEEFGVAGAEQIITAIDNGAPIVALAVIYRETPEALVSLKEENITSPKDLEGKTVGVIYGNDETLYRMFIKKNKVNSKKINEVPALTGTSQVLTGKVNAKMAYEMNDAILLELDGKEINLLKFRDYGVDVYADTIFTTKKMIEENPEKVQKFVNASLKGWEKAIENPSKAVDELLKVSPTLNYDQQLGYLQASIPIIKPDENIGLSDAKIWENMVNEFYNYKIIKNKLDASKIFTNDFIKL